MVAIAGWGCSHTLFANICERDQVGTFGFMFSQVLVLDVVCSIKAAGRVQRCLGRTCKFVCLIEAW